MGKQTPRVSIGMPVYNGEEFVEQAINAILGQTYTDFELIISDNASTDRTGEICERYAAQDARIHYQRVEKNMGAAWNFNRVAGLARGEFFKWAAHDDVILPDYLEKCVGVLDQHPEVILCGSKVRLIDGVGNTVEILNYQLNTNSPRPRVRFHDLIIKYHLCHEIFGLMRLNVLRQTPLVGNYGHGDGVLLERLAMLGQFYEIPEVLFLARTHAKQSMKVYGALSDKRDNNYHQYTAWFDPQKAGKIIFPTWRILVEHLATLSYGQVDLTDRLYCFFYFLHWVYRRRLPLLLDLWIAIQQIWARTFSRQPAAPRAQVTHR